MHTRRTYRPQVGNLKLNLSSIVNQKTAIGRAYWQMNMARTIGGRHMSEMSKLNDLHSGVLVFKRVPYE